MDKQTVMQWISRLRQPLPILLIVTASGLLFNILLFSYSFLPVVRKQVEYTLEYGKFDRLVSSIERTPIPPKATPNEIGQLVKQVPTKEELSRFIIQMKEIELKSGVTLTKLTFGEEKKETDNLTSIVMGQTKIGQMTVPSAVPNNNGTATAQPPANNPAPSSTASSKLQELKGNMSVRGTYTQIVDFFNRLYQLDRIVNVKKWDMAPSAGELNGFQTLIPKLQKENEPLLLQAKMEFAIYAAQQYSGKLPDLPPLSVPSPEAPKVPILTDQQYYDLLKSAAGQ